LQVKLLKNGRIYHNEDYLGKVIDREIGLFKSCERGYFTFSTENGFGEPNPLTLPLEYVKPFRDALNFGGVWMVDHILKQTGLAGVIENLIPDAGDTIKALVAFRVLSSFPYSYAEGWHLRSFARVLYPAAVLESSLISKFHVLLGNEEVYINFFSKYLSIITKNNTINEQISIPILIDSTGLPNDIRTHLTAVNNHNGVISNEIRLIYVLDKNTKLPIYFRYLSSNIIDNSTLITTINSLSTFGVDIEIVIMDAGYSSLNNLQQLLINNIPFVTRMPSNRTDYKELIRTYRAQLEEPENTVVYDRKSLYGLRVPYTIFDKDIFAFIMLDLQKQFIDHDSLVQKYNNDPEGIAKMRTQNPFNGTFIIFSSVKYDVSDILPIYYTRQSIEQSFDVSKNFADTIH
jgi:hypothetical protein